VLRWLTILKLGLIAFLLVWGFGLQLGSWSNFVPFVAQRSGSVPLFEALAAGLVAAFFVFGGWWDVTKLAAEVRDPVRNLPRALAYGVLIVGLVYILTSAVFLYLVPLSSVTSAETFAAQAGEVLFGRAGAKLFSAFVVISVLGSLTAIVMSAPRVYFAMAKDGLFASAVAAVHPKFGTPARAIALQAIVASILVLFGNFNEIVSYFIFVLVIFIGLTIAALFILRHKSAVISGYQTPGYPFTPIFYLVLTVVLLVLMASNNPKQAFLGVGVVALGIPVYYFYVRVRNVDAGPP
jgi:APA family basic amino acid/polyamine antiporter